MKRIRIVAILAALVTAGALYLFLTSIKKPETILRLPVIVAAVDIKEGTLITSGMVEEKMLPEESILSQAAKKKDAVVGQVTSVDVKAGEQMLLSKVFVAGESKSGLAYTIDKGMRAFTLPVDQFTGVAGFIKPLDRVDVLVLLDVNGVVSPSQFKDLMDKMNGVSDETPAPDATPAPPDATPSPTPAPTGAAPQESGPTVKLVYSLVLLQNIKVLATGNVMQATTSDAAPAAVESVTLCLTPEEALRLNLAMSEGKGVRLVLRPSGEADLPDLEGTTVVNLIDSSDIQMLTLLGDIGLADLLKPKPTVSPRPTATPSATAGPSATPGPSAAASPSPSPGK